MIARLGVKFAPSISDIMSKLGNDDSKPQFDGDLLEDMSTSITALLSSVFIFSSTKKMDTGFKTLCQFDRMKNTLLDVAKFVMKCVENIYNHINVELYGAQKLRFMKSGVIEIDNFFSKCDSITRDVDKSLFDCTPSNLQQVTDCVNEAKDILRYSGNDVKIRSIRSSIQTEVNYLIKLKEKLLAASPDIAGLKQEPVCVYITGAPGIGKSPLMMHLMNALSSTFLSDDEMKRFEAEPTTFLYNCMAENKYHDGYNRNKSFTLFDDFGQNKTVAGVPDNEFMMFLRMVNSFPCLLHMSDIKDKGVTYFDSKLVIISSNMTTVTCDAIYDINAIKRRLNSHSFVACPKEEYCTETTIKNDVRNRKIDFSKVPTGVCDIPSLHPDLLEFHEFDVIENKLSGPILTFEQLIRRLIIAHHINSDRHRQMMSEMVETRSKYDIRQFADKEDILMETVPQGALDDFRNHVVPTPLLENFFCKDPVLNRAISKVIFNIENNHYDFFDKRNTLKRLFLKLHAANTECDKTLCLNIGLYFGSNFLEWVVESDIKEFDDEVNDFIVENPYLIPLPIKIYYGAKDSWLSLTVDSFNKTKNSFISKCKLVSDMIRDECPVFARAVTSFLKFVITNKEFLFLICAALVYRYNSKRTTVRKIFTEDEDGKLYDEPDWIEHVVPQYDKVKTQDRPLSSKAIKVKPETVPQMGQYRDNSRVEIMQKIVKKNLYQMFVQLRGNEFSRFGHAFNVTDRFLIIPYHFILRLLSARDKDAAIGKNEIRLKKYAGYTYIFCINDFLDSFHAMSNADSDLCIVLLPKKFQPGTNCIKYIASYSIASSMREYNYCLTIIKQDSETLTFEGVAKPFSKHPVQSDLGNYEIAKGYAYGAATSSGDCGALMSLDSATTGCMKIFGMHVAGGESMVVGFSALLTQDDIQATIEKFPDYDPYVEEECPYPTVPQDGFLFFDRFEIDSKLVNVPFSPGVTNIKRSALRSTWGEPKLKPAHLRPVLLDDELVDPFRNALSNYSRGDVYIPQDLVSHAAADLFDTFNDVEMVKPDKRLYSREEVICGIVGDKCFNHIPRTTSLGYPYNAIPSPGNPGKTRFLGHEQDINFESSEWSEFSGELDRLHNLLRKGIRPWWAYTDFLKDETRPIPKVDMLSTRHISACPFSYAYFFRMYFGSFMNYMNSNRILNGSAVCVNPYSCEWDFMARNLNKYGPKLIWDGDYAKFDGSQLSQIHWELVKRINLWYGDSSENQRIRTLLFFEITNSRHIYKGLVYIMMQSMPSGNPGTTLINVLYNLVSFRMCFGICFGIPQIPKFRFNVFVVVLGDDNVWSTASEILDDFNALTLQTFMKMIGLTYTAANKGSVDEQSKTVEEIDFLKRNFRKCDENGLYVAPLQLGVILEMVLWTKKGPNSIAITRDNVSTALRELSLHGREIFDFYAPQFCKSLYEAHDCYPDSSDFDINLTKVLSLEEFY
nr:non-structural polyprotein [Flumine dicistrovirus 5]